MTLKQFNPKLNDIQNRPLVVLCLFLFSVIVTVVPFLWYDGKSTIATYSAEVLSLRAQIDSMNREQIIMYRNGKMKDVLIMEQTEAIKQTDSILRAKTEKPMQRILNANPQ